MSNLMEALMAASRDEERNGRRRPTSPEAICLTLREVAERYAQPCPIVAGQLVTPRRDTDIKWIGDPHIVLEVIERPNPDFKAVDPAETISNTYGARRDMRVATENHQGGISRYWVESTEFEPYTGPGSDAA